MLDPPKMYVASNGGAIFVDTSSICKIVLEMVVSKHKRNIFPVPPYPCTVSLNHLNFLFL